MARAVVCIVRNLGEPSVSAAEARKGKLMAWVRRSEAAVPARQDNSVTPLRQWIRRDDIAQSSAGWETS